MRAFLIGLFVLLATLASAAGEIEWRVSAATTNSAKVEAKLKEGWHLYSTVTGKPPKPTEFLPQATSFSGVGATKVDGISESKPIRQLDKNFGFDVDYFKDTASFDLKLSGVTDPKTDKIAVRYQLCNDRTCLPPKTVELPLSGEASTTSGTSAAAGSTSGAANSGDVTGQIADAKKAGLLPFLGFAFVAGLLALLTPCVFPMIPITVSYFSKQKSLAGEDPSVKRPSPISQAIAFCVGIVGTYTVFGLGITLIFGASSVQNFATNPWVNLALAALFVYLALNLFGAVQVYMPSSLTNRFSSEGKGGLLAPALMGFTFTLTSFTCAVGFVGAIFGAAAAGDILYPLLGMLAFGSAFALPFFLLALFPSFLAKLPKSGSWMETVKATMGFVELMAALKFLSNADLVKNATPWFPRPVFLAIWAGIAAVTALWLFGAIRLPSVHDGKTIGWLRRGFATAFVAMTILFLGAIPGRGLGYVDSFLPPSAGAGSDTYSEVQRLARAEGKPILLNFTGVTCTNCRFMEQNIFPHSAVKPEIEKYVVGELYTDRESQPGDAENRKLQLKLTGTEALPVYVLISPDGAVLRKFEGSTNDPAQFASFLKGG